MKKLFTIIAILFSSVIYAQNNLQFNAAIYIKLVAPYYNYDTTIIVPPNKVWKIESCSAGSPGSGGFVYIDGVVISAANNFPNTNALPIWLPSGNYTFSLTVLKGFVSAIEFNIVP